MVELVGVLGGCIRLGGRKGISLLCLMAMSCGCIGPRVASLPNCSAAGHSRDRGIVPMIGWFFRSVRLSEGGKLWRCSV